MRSYSAGVAWMSRVLLMRSAMTRTSCPSMVVVTLGPCWPPCCCRLRPWPRPLAPVPKPEPVPNPDPDPVPKPDEPVPSPELPNTPLRWLRLAPNWPAKLLLTLLLAPATLFRPGATPVAPLKPVVWVVVPP